MLTHRTARIWLSIAGIGVYLCAIATFMALRMGAAAYVLVIILPAVVALYLTIWANIWHDTRQWKHGTEQTGATSQRDGKDSCES